MVRQYNQNWWAWFGLECSDNHSPWFKNLKSLVKSRTLNAGTSQDSHQRETAKFCVEQFFQDAKTASVNVTTKKERLADIVVGRGLSAPSKVKVIIQGQFHFKGHMSQGTHKKPYFAIWNQVVKILQIDRFIDDHHILRGQYYWISLSIN